MQIARHFDKFVLQCPGLTSVCMMTLDRLPKDGTLVLFCMRDVQDILASYERIGWKGGGVERRSYLTRYGDYLKDACLEDEPLPVIVYSVWRNLQKPMVPHWFEFEYAKLK